MTLFQFALTNFHRPLSISDMHVLIAQQLRHILRRFGRLQFGNGLLRVELDQRVTRFNAIAFAYVYVRKESSQRCRHKRVLNQRDLRIGDLDDSISLSFHVSRLGGKQEAEQQELSAAHRKPDWSLQKLDDVHAFEALA